MAEIKHIEAFEDYYAMGSARSYAKLAQKIGKSCTIVEKWGKVEGWQEEVGKRDVEILKANRENCVKELSRSCESYRKIIDASIGQYVDQLKKGKIKITSVGDLEKLVRLRVYIDEWQIGISHEDIAECVGTQQAASNTDTTNVKDNEEITFKFV